MIKFTQHHKSLFLIKLGLLYSIFSFFSFYFSFEAYVCNDVLFIVPSWPRVTSFPLGLWNTCSDRRQLSPALKLTRWCEYLHMRRSSCNFGWNPTFISVNYYSAPNPCRLRLVAPIQIMAVIRTHLCKSEGQAASRTCSPCAHTWCCSGLAAGSRGHTEMSRCHRAPCCPRIASRWRGCRGHCRLSLSWLEV